MVIFVVDHLGTIKSRVSSKNDKPIVANPAQKMSTFKV